MAPIDYFNHVITLILKRKTISIFVDLLNPMKSFWSNFRIKDFCYLLKLSHLRRNLYLMWYFLVNVLALQIYGLLILGVHRLDSLIWRNDCILGKHFDRLYSLEWKRRKTKTMTIENKIIVFLIILVIISLAVKPIFLTLPWRFHLYKSPLTSLQEDYIVLVKTQSHWAERGRRH